MKEKAKVGCGCGSAHAEAGWEPAWRPRVTRAVRRADDAWLAEVFTSARALDGRCGGATAKPAHLFPPDLLRAVFVRPDGCARTIVFA